MVKIQDNNGMGLVTPTPGTTEDTVNIDKNTQQQNKLW